MKHGIRLLSAILIFSIALGICGCEREFLMREDLEPMVKEYVVSKYGFEPVIEDWRTEDEPITRSYIHYVTLNDGTDQFEVRVAGPNYRITDDYERTAIYEDMREWADNILPGAVHAYCDHEFFEETQKYTGDVWKFMEENNVYPSITLTYVNLSLDSDEVSALVEAIDDLGLTGGYNIVSCPTEEDAELVWENAFVGGYNDIIRYSPYVDESLSYHGPSYDLQYHRYDLRETDGIYYCEVVAHGDEPTPDSEFSVVKADGSLSDFFPTFMVNNNRSSLDDYSRADINVCIFVPLSMIDEEIVYADNHGITCAGNLTFVESSDLNGQPYDCFFNIYGDYASLSLYCGLGGEYFSIDRAD